MWDIFFAYSYTVKVISNVISRGHATEWAEEKININIIISLLKKEINRELSAEELKVDVKELDKWLY